MTQLISAIKYVGCILTSSTDGEQTEYVGTNFVAKTPKGRLVLTKTDLSSYCYADGSTIDPDKWQEGNSQQIKKRS